MVDYGEQSLPIATTAELKRSVLKAWEELTVDTLAIIAENFGKRLKAYRTAKGGRSGVNLWLRVCICVDK